MDPQGFAVIAAVTGIGAAIVGVVFAAKRATARRREGLAAEAARMGFGFTPGDEEWLRKELAPFHLFSRGHGRRIANVLRGKAKDLEIAVFDYRSTTGGGQHSSTHSQTVLLFENPRGDFPGFSLRPEHLFHRIGKVFGYQDINFDGFPQFSRQYLLQAENEPAVRSLFTADTLQHLSEHKGICVEAAGGRLVVYRPGKKVEPAAIEAFIRDGVYLYALLSSGMTRPA